jgi:hypothetical protein
VQTVATDGDGRFALHVERGSLRPEKVRIRSAAHRATVISLSDVDGDLPLLPRGPVARLRVLDLEGKPIAGARLRTHQTCAHAPPAVVAFSDAEGLIETDELPPLRDGADLQLDADGFEMRYGIDESLPWAPLDEAAAVVRLAKRRPLNLLVLERDGMPASDARIVLDAAPSWSAAVTDADGAVSFPSRASGSAIVRRFCGETEEILYDGWGTGGEPATLRFGGDAVERGSSRLRIDLAGSKDGGAVPLLAWHGDGWFTTTPGEHRCPSGRIRVHIGAAFSGYVHAAHDVELGDLSSDVLWMKPRPEPELTIVDLDEDDEWIVVEAEGESKRLAATGHEETLHVPPDVPLRLMIQSRDATRISALEPLSDAREISRGSIPVAERRIDPEDDARLTATLRFRVPEELAGTRVTVFAPQRIDATPAAPGVLEARVLPGVAFEAWFAADDESMPRAFVGVAPPAGEAIELHVPR